MMKSTLLCVFAVVGCGGSLTQNEAIQVRFVPDQRQGNRESSDDKLGIIAASKDQQGAGSAVKTKSGAEPAKVAQAFGSYVRFVAGSTGQSCGGVFSYEMGAANPNFVNVYFNSAAHCFEKINALGMVVMPLRKSSVVFGNSSASPVSFVKPFGPGNVLPLKISFSKVEALYDSLGARTDAIRVLVGQQPLSVAEKLFLPNCSSYVPSSSSSSDDRALHALGSDRNLSGLFVASVKASGLRGLPPALVGVLNAAEQNVPQVMELEDVGSFAGESGGPVFQVMGRADISRVDGYECVSGIISREMVSAEVGLTGSLELSMSTYYTSISSKSSGFVWKELL